MATYRDLSQILLELRKEKGITQIQLGKEIGVTNKTISKWEKGVFLPDITYLVSIADYYGISVDELLRGTIYDSKRKDNKITMILEKEARKKMIKIIPILLVLIQICQIFIHIEYILARPYRIVLNSLILVLAVIYLLVSLINFRRIKKQNKRTN